MSARYLAALDYSELHAKMVLQKHRKKRPLGEIEDRYRYTPPQPVLSCRTVDIDVSGTRTYRAKSSADIIAEQHRLIHNVYQKARAAQSAPVRRPQYQSSEEHGVSALKSLKIHGTSNYVSGQDSEPESLGNSPRDSTPRPASAVHATGVPRPFVIRRPKTTGSLKKVKPATNTFLKIRVDPAIHESTQLFRETSDKVREQWEPENHSLDEGKFVRGKKSENTAKLDQSGQWLTFGGGQLAKSAGVVEAFTSMKGDSEYYTIEGSIGGDVARHLRRGDKIRIGINGIVQSRDLKVKKWTKDQKKNESDVKFVEDSRTEMFQSVPLCWSDQVKRPDSHIVKATGPKEEQPKHNLCDTHPVIFNSKIKDKEQNGQKQGAAQSAKTSGFKVKSRVKSRKWAGGMDSSSSITSLSIEHRGEEEEMELDRITPEDILKSLNVADKQSSPSSSTDQQTKQADLLAEYINNIDQESELQDEPSISSSRPNSETSDARIEVTNKTRMNQSRPVTAPYSTSPDPELVTSNLLVSSGRKDTPQTPDRVSTPRSSAGIRPTPVKPLHKAMPSVASISSSGRGDVNLGYIQLTQPVYIPKDQQMKNDMILVSGATSAAIQHISDHNKPEPMLNVNNNRIEDSPRAVTELNERNRKISDSSQPNISTKKSATSPLNSHAVTPAPSRAETPEVHYHIVDIPTGETFPDSGRNSAVDSTFKAEDEI